MKALTVATLLAAGVAFVQAGETKGAEPRASKSDKAPAASHKTVGVVKKIDPKADSVTLAHEPVKSLSWPSMTMAFQVRDKAMLDRFAEGKKVEVEFQQQGKDYVITSVK